MRNPEGDAVLHEAIRASDDQTVKLLLNNGTTPNMLSCADELPLAMVSHLPTG